MSSRTAPAASNSSLTASSFGQYSSYRTVAGELLRGERMRKTEQAAENASGPGRGSGHDYDAVIVGASLAGCASALFLARAGARVALVEQRSDPAAYKKICSHYVQASAVPTLE